MYRVTSRLLALLLVVAIVGLTGNLYGAPPLKEWTLAVYLNADNDLDEFGVADELEMAQVGSNEWLNIVTMNDRAKAPCFINYIEKGKVTTIKDLGEVDMGDYRQLVKFMQFIVTNYPAKRYILTIWNHGSGWKFKDGNQIFRGISYDDSSNNHITNEQLGLALAQIKEVIGRPLDILNMDACLMQMAEVAHACRHSCSYIVASEENEPGAGTPYDEVFKRLTKQSTPENFVKSWVKNFVGSYLDGNQGCDDATQSALKMSEFGNLTDAVNGFCKAIMSGKFTPQFISVLHNVQSFSDRDNIDLLHLAELIKKSIPETGVQTACGKLIEAGKKCIVANRNTGVPLENAKGLAIYFPANFRLDPRYKELSWAKATLWDEMIADLYRKERAFSLATGLSRGDIDSLRRFVDDAPRVPGDIIREVVNELNYCLLVERSVPATIFKEACKLLDQLKTYLS